MRNLRQAFAIGAASVALAGGIALTSADVAAAAPSGTAATMAPATHVTSSSTCRFIAGHSTRVFHPRWRDHRGHWHPGYWTTVWHGGHRVCVRVRG